MSFYKYDKKRFLEDIEKGSIFDFKSSSWVIILSVFSFFIFIPIGIVFFTFSLPFGSMVGIIFMIMSVIGLCTGIQLNSRKITINPKRIKWSGGFSSGKVNFIEIEDISFFPSVFFNLNTAKIFTYKGQKFKIRTSFMKSPKNWYSEDMIRTVIDYYWHAANPDAKHSKKSVSSVPSEGKKTISLIKNLEKNKSSLEGTKCPNCLFIAEKKVKFCPKCGSTL